MNDDEYAYLRDGFNPRNLRKDQLRSVLLTHGVEYSNDMLKPQLIEIFQSEIAPRRAELRAKFVDVAASAENIENATPPQSHEARAGTSKRTDSAPQPHESPRARRARSRSPVRARSPARDRKAVKAEAGLETAKQSTPLDDAGKTASLSDVPKLAPPPSAPEQPASPRRRRANRKVEVPGTEPETIDVVPTEEIKIKAPRSPRKRRAESEVAGDESFSKLNVFQSRPASKRRKETPASAGPSKAAASPASSPKAAAIKESPRIPEWVPEPAKEEELPELQHTMDTAPVTEADIGIDILPLDADFVADLNAEVDRLQSDPLFNFDQSQHLPASEDPYEYRDEATSPPAPVDSRGTTPSAFGSSRASSRAETPVVQTPAMQTPAQRRRGFIPSLAELSVSRAFAEQLEPYLAATPTPTPRNSTPAARLDSPRPEPRQRESSPSSESPTELPDAEEVAAQGIHDVLDHAADTVHNHGRIRLLPRWRPRLPAVRLPRVRMPAVHLPRVRVPAFRAPAVRFPAVHLPAVRFPTVRFPAVRFPAIRSRIPRLRAPRLPRLPKLPLPSLSYVGYIAFFVASIAVNLSLISLGVMLAMWYRDAWANAEFCEVGAVATHVYPEWTFYDTGYDAIGKVQANFRDMMDEVWPECVSCPSNAKCYQGRILMCDKGYRQVEHPLSLEGLLPYPPRCKPDWEAQRKVNVLSERAAFHIRNKRAEILCDRPDIKEEDVQAASAMAADELRALLFGQKSPLLSDEEFEALLEQAIDELPSRYDDLYVVSFDPSLVAESSTVSEVEHGDIKNNNSGQMLTNVQKDADHNRAGERKPGTPSFATEKDSAPVWLVSSSDALMPFSCRAERWIQAHKLKIVYAVLLTSAVSLISLVVVRREKARRRRQRYVEDFVARLKQQRKKADLDATRKTVPYLRATELRKEVPKAQWKNVQESLEAVDGVRMRQIEVYGEITRIWEWTR